jgi:hypothetical protein
MLFRFLEGQPLPLTVSLTKGGKRSLRQNKLQRLWLNEIAEQLGDQTPEEVRGYCKLTIGVPILRAENEDFRAKYDAIVKPLPYEDKLALMMEPLDFPVSRLLSTEQHARYLDGIFKHFSERGIILTIPEDFDYATQKRKQEQGPRTQSLQARDDENADL